MQRVPEEKSNQKSEKRQREESETSSVSVQTSYSSDEDISQEEEDQSVYIPIVFVERCHLLVDRAVVRLEELCGMLEETRNSALDMVSQSLEELRDVKVELGEFLRSPDEDDETFGESLECEMLDE